MQLTDVFLSLGRDSFGQLLGAISMGKLRTYQLYKQVRTRAHLAKLNAETLRKAGGRLWDRIAAREEDLAKDLAQAVLVSHLDMIAAVLNYLGIPNEEGFFAKETDPKPYLTEGWEQRVLENFQGVYPEALVRFYIGHLAWEVHAK